MSHKKAQKMGHKEAQNSQREFSPFELFAPFSG
jgi:hypothetical protein